MLRIYIICSIEKLDVSTGHAGQKSVLWFGALGDGATGSGFFVQPLVHKGNVQGWVKLFALFVPLWGFGARGLMGRDKTFAHRHILS